MVKKVILASPRGFCAGVVRAVDIVNIALDTYPKPVYVRKEIVHNPHVVNELRGRGAVFVDSIDEVPAAGTVIFSAHGVSPEVWRQARSRNLNIIDATCPLVTKVHMEAIRYARKDFTIVLIGHEGHEEVEGTLGEAPDHMVLISTVADVDSLEVDDPERVAYVTQTTLSLDDTREIIQALRRKFPKIQGPAAEDICYATQNRQLAVRQLAARAELVLVVGAANSSNSNRLVEEAVRYGAKSHLIRDVNSIRAEWLENVEVLGLTSGASAPELLVQDVVRHFERQGAIIEELITREENVHFALPSSLVQDARRAGRTVV